MRRLFVDTAFLIALLDAQDYLHRRAASFDLRTTRLTTSDLVLTELLNSLGTTWLRGQAARYVLNWLDSRSVQVVHHNSLQYAEAVRFYEQRPDKHWSLTDCASFLIMERLGILDALTADRHFEQAGYTALLLD